MSYAMGGGGGTKFCMPYIRVYLCDVACFRPTWVWLYPVVNRRQAAGSQASVFIRTPNEKQIHLIKNQK